MDPKQRLNQGIEQIKEVNRKAEAGTDGLVDKLRESKYTSVIVWGGAIIAGAFAAFLIFG